MNDMGLGAARKTYECGVLGRLEARDMALPSSVACKDLKKRKIKI